LEKTARQILATYRDALTPEQMAEVEKRVAAFLAQRKDKPLQK